MRTSKELETNKKKERTQQLIKLTESFCNTSLDGEYKELCKKLVFKMSRKRNVPFLSGRIEIWAAAIIHALGSINFLFDKKTKPYVTAEDICKFFGTSRSTTSQKANVIKDMFKLYYFDDEFSTSYNKERNPLSKVAMINGFITMISDLPNFSSEIESVFRDNENGEILIIKVTLDERYAQKHIFRLLAIQATDTLYDLAEAIVQSFDFDFDHSFGFFDNIKNWTKSDEKYEISSGVIEDSELINNVKEVTINEVFNEIEKKMLFLYDFGDEWQFIVELIVTDSRDPDLQYPCIVKSVGKAPIQYKDDENEEKVARKNSDNCVKKSLCSSQTSLDLFT